MFYCSKCQKQNRWHNTLFKSYGRCEVCKKPALCNDMPSKDLLKPPKEINYIERK